MRRNRNARAVRLGQASYHLTELEPHLVRVNLDHPSKQEVAHVAGKIAQAVRVQP